MRRIHGPRISASPAMVTITATATWRAAASASLAARNAPRPASTSTAPRPRRNADWRPPVKRLERLARQPVGGPGQAGPIFVAGARPQERDTERSERERPHDRVAEPQPELSQEKQYSGDDEADGNGLAEVASGQVTEPEADPPAAVRLAHDHGEDDVERDPEPAGDRQDDERDPHDDRVDAQLRRPVRCTHRAAAGRHRDAGWLSVSESVVRVKPSLRHDRTANLLVTMGHDPERVRVIPDCGAGRAHPMMAPWNRNRRRRGVWCADRRAATSPGWRRGWRTTSVSIRCSSASRSWWSPSSGAPGLIAYAAGWLLVPEEGASESIAEEAIHNHNWGRIAGFVLLAVAASLLLQPLSWFGGHVLAAVALILLGLYLLWRRDDPDSQLSTPAPPPSEPVSPAVAAAWPPPTQSRQTPPTPPPAPPPPTQPPPHLRRPQHGVRGVGGGRGLASVAVGVLLVGAGLLGLVLAAGGTVEPTRVFAGGLIIVGAALVVSAWFGRGFALIPLGVLLVALLSVSSLIDVPFKGGFGDRVERPTTLTDVQDEYHLAAGQLTVDLGQVAFPAGTTTDVKATVGTGHLVVIVPRGVEVDVHGHAGAGDVQFLGDQDHQGGIRVDRDATLHARPGAPRLALDAEVGLGQVEVRDATA